MTEIIDLVNEKDEIIGDVDKDGANQNPKLIHREVAVCLLDSNRRMLMQQRSFQKKVYPGYWTETCAGHVLKGEDPEKAAHRELVEEMGFDTQLKLIEKDINHFPNETFFGYGYVGFYNGEKISIQEEEINQIKFLNGDEFEQLIKSGEKVDEITQRWVRKVFYLFNTKNGK